MLDEDEYAVISRLYSQATSAVKEYRHTWDVSLNDTPFHELYEPVYAEYERMTGMRESDHNEILKHRISIYGEPCKQCQKPLRTPEAKICGACMHPVQESGGLNSGDLNQAF